MTIRPTLDSRRGFARYYGGKTLDTVADTVGRLANRGVGACVSLLPEMRFRPRGVEREKKDILAILPSLRRRGLSADLTIKLSQLGQRWTPDDCFAALAEIARQAAGHGAFVWIDMERAKDVDLTLEQYRAVRKIRSNVGLCLQTYLRRTKDDLERLLADGHPARLVKGYFRESSRDQFDTWRETTENMKKLLPPLIEGGVHPAVGTHDETVIAEAERLLALHPRADFEYQFFLGAKPHLPVDLARRGRRARVYVPYGRLFRYFLHTAPKMDLSRNIQRALGRAVIR